MVGNIILYFSTLSAAFSLKSPLPPYLPPAEDARLRLVSGSHYYLRLERDAEISITDRWTPLGSSM